MTVLELGGGNKKGNMNKDMVLGESALIIEI